MRRVTLLHAADVDSETARRRRGLKNFQATVAPKLHEEDDPGYLADEEEEG